MASIERSGILARFGDAAGAAVETVRSSVSAAVFALGFALLLAAVALEVAPERFATQGTWAAILGLWGVGLLLVAAGIRTVRWWIRR